MVKAHATCVDGEAQAKPARQALGTDDPAGQNVPLTHDVAAGTPSAQNEPTGHRACEDVFVQTYPAGQRDVFVVDPAAQKVPAPTQATCNDGDGQKLPNRHGVWATEPDGQ